MDKLLENLNLTEYFPGAILWTICTLLAAVILIIGFWISGRAYKARIEIPFPHRKIILVKED
ncbi:MAG: small conductance mechanosensitive channel [Kangiellaceae bacterium]|jgi:small conductance mechanosensitive channel